MATPIGPLFNCRSMKRILLTLCIAGVGGWLVYFSRARVGESVSAALPPPRTNNTNVAVDRGSAAPVSGKNPTSIEITLDESERAAVSELAVRVRTQVMEAFARHGKFDRLDDGSVRWQIELPAPIAEDLRANFHAGIQQILGQAKGRLWLMGNDAVKAEAELEFFGLFPTVLEFRGMDAPFADAQFVTARTSLARKDEAGSYDAFWEEHLESTSFREKFGALARISFDGR